MQIVLSTTTKIVIKHGILENSLYCMYVSTKIKLDAVGGVEIDHSEMKYHALANSRIYR